MKTINRLLVIVFTVITLSAAAQPVKDRIVSNDPTKYKLLNAVHGGAGQMHYVQMIGSKDMSTNFLYLHSGTINAKSGIGHHFHHSIEEMYVLLSGEAEFTVNGRTSKIKAPAIVPCKMGDAHAIYNASDEPVRWLNFGVSTIKGKGDNFDLGDTRVGAAIDPIPVFVSARLERARLRANNPAYPGNGVLYRRIFGPEIFKTNWDHVDDVVLPAGSSAGPRQLDGIEEVYFVVKGSGTVTINNENAAIKKEDALFGLMGEKVSFANTGKDDLELLVIGVAASKQMAAGVQSAVAKPKGITLQMDFVVTKENNAAFEKMYNSIYVPAMKVQKGYLGSKLLRLFPENYEKGIEAEPTTYNYQLQIYFATEEDRKLWVASPQHVKTAWPGATALAKVYKWRGYDVMDDDEQNSPVKPRGITLQMDFVVSKENSEAFKNMYTSTYVPAMKVQKGYLGSKVLRLFSENYEKGIEAEPTTYNYQLQIYFATEEDRKLWVASPQHVKIAWPSATALAKVYKWRGYDVMGDDDNRK
ncbi:MAG: Cupin 2 conserved barrel domain protein [Mucilaginibacter sp.]|nr:Cupin 2 conserved barrel domain protein [Mucilaginibacter sp.]